MAKPGRPRIYPEAPMTAAQRQRRHRMRHSDSSDMRWIRLGDPEFVGRSIATAIFDFRKVNRHGWQQRWYQIAAAVEAAIADLEQEFRPRQVTKPHAKSHCRE